MTAAAQPATTLARRLETGLRPVAGFGIVAAALSWSAMGEFVAVTAVQTDQVSGLSDAISSFFSQHGWGIGAPDAGAEVDYGNDILMYAPVGGWTVVGWPSYFIELATAQFVSQELEVLTSTVRIHDGDYWSHTLFRSGQVLDRFASVPDYFTDDSAEVARLASKWAGNSETVAAAFSKPVSEVAPYLVHLLTEHDDDDGADEMDDEPWHDVKVFPDDEFELGDAWVFIDFWRRLGITYPADVTRYAARLRLSPGWQGKLPEGDAEL